MSSTPPPNGVLLIIHSIIELYKIWQQILPHFPSNSRHTLGFRIDTLIIQIAESIFTASFMANYKKLALIEESSIKLDSVKFLLQLSWESKIINDKKYIFLSNHLEKVGRQIGGWLKQLRKQNSPR
ncbi:MAG: four helix bundle protein [Patescibacteria group bacterium]